MRLLYLFLFAAIVLSEAFANKNNHLYRRLLIAGKDGSVIIQPESLIPGSTYPNEGRPETDKHIIHFQDKFYQLFHRKDTILLQESINGIEWSPAQAVSADGQVVEADRSAMTVTLINGKTTIIIAAAEYRNIINEGSYRIVRSDDGGAHFTSVTLPTDSSYIPLTFELYHNNDGIVYFLGYYANKGNNKRTTFLAQSTTGGDTWSVPFELESASSELGSDYEFSMSAHHEHAIIATADPQQSGRNVLVYRTSDYGATWDTYSFVGTAAPSAGIVSVTVLFDLSENAHLLWSRFAEASDAIPAYVVNHAVSKDWGATWRTNILDSITSDTHSPLSGLSRESLQLNLTSTPTGTLYAMWMNAEHMGAQTYAVYLARSTDQGSSWHRVDTIDDSRTEPNTPHIHWIGGSIEQDSLLMIWTDWRFNTSSVRNQANSPHLLQCIPNPAIDRVSFTIDAPPDNLKLWSLGSSNFYSVPVEYTSGECVLDIRDLPQGAYFVCLNKPNMQRIGKFSIVR